MPPSRPPALRIWFRIPPHPHPHSVGAYGEQDREKRQGTGRREGEKEEAEAGDRQEAATGRVENDGGREVRRALRATDSEADGERAGDRGCPHNTNNVGKEESA